MRALLMTVEDVGANQKYRQRLLDVLADCFSNIIRLSSTVTGCRGAVSSLTSSFVNMVAYKASQIAESSAQAENIQEENQEVIERAEKRET